MSMSLKAARRRKPLAQYCTLSDGRRLGFDQHGPVTGIPLFLFHGVPSSRLDWYLFGTTELTRQLNLRVIAVDRPGIGCSSPRSDARLMDWPADVATLADRLGLTRFGVLGYSGGGPFALACARLLPERLTAVGVVSGELSHNVAGVMASMSTASRQFFTLCRFAPSLGRGLLMLMGMSARRDSEQFLAQMLASLPAPDRRVMTDSAKQRAFLATVREALRQGPRGAQEDAAQVVRPWGFQLEEIAVPVHLWHGQADQNAPVAMGHYLAQHLPQCHAAFYPNEGHLSLVVHHAQEILEGLFDPH
jgi:pimeloyl-ACP methyl ester carboxylesterase